MAAKNKEITLESLHNLIVTRFDSLEKRITSLEDRMTSLEYRVSSLEIEMTRMKESLDFVRETTVAMNKKFEGEFEKIYLYTNSKTGALERDLTSHEFDLAKIKTELKLYDKHPNLEYKRSKGPIHSE